MHTGHGPLGKALLEKIVRDPDDFLEIPSLIAMAYKLLDGNSVYSNLQDACPFKGMKRGAALDSWGYPDEMKENEMGGVLNEQWIYFDPRLNKKRYIWFIGGAVDKWAE